MKYWIIGATLAAGFSMAMAQEVPVAPNIDALIAGLDDDSFALREKAGAELLAYGKANADVVGRALAKAFRQSPAPEIRERSRELLRELFTGGVGYVGVYYAADALLGKDGALIRGVRVNMVSPKSPAAEAQIQPGDLILAVDGHVLAADTPDLDFAQRVQMRGVGQAISLKILRAADELEIKITLAERPIPLAPEQAEALFNARLKELEQPPVAK